MSFTDGPGLAVSEATKLVTANAGSQIQLEVVPAALVRDETEPVPASSAPSVAEQKSPEPPAPAPGMLENAALWSKSMRFVFFRLILVKRSYIVVDVLHVKLMAVYLFRLLLRSFGLTTGY